MNLVDANVLIYAVNLDAPHHDKARAWLDGQLSGDGPVAFAWVALLAFLRLATKEGLFPRPLDPAAALDRIDAWLAAPPAVVLHPTPEHPRVVRRLLVETGGGAELVNDAHLAALAIEHRCGIASFDRDFGRFPGVDWIAPG